MHACIIHSLLAADCTHIYIYIYIYEEEDACMHNALPPCRGLYIYIHIYIYIYEEEDACMHNAIPPCRGGADIVFN